MSLKAEERLPGVTFYLESATQEPSITHKAKGRIVLTADIDDFELWDQTVLKLNGLRIYDSESIQTEMLELLQEDGEKLQSELERAKENHRVEKERLSTELANSEQKVSSLLLTNARLSKRLSELETLKAELDALSNS